MHISIYPVKKNAFSGSSVLDVIFARLLQILRNVNSFLFNFVVLSKMFLFSKETLKQESAIFFYKIMLRKEIKVYNYSTTHASSQYTVYTSSVLRVGRRIGDVEVETSVRV